MEKEITIIEISADSLYLVIVGDKKSIDKLAVSFNANNADDIKYFSAKIDIPSCIKCEELSKTLNKQVLTKPGMETAHCYTYAEGFSGSTHMLITLETIDDNYFMGYPKFDLGEYSDPEKVMYDWIKKKMQLVPKSVKKSMKAMTLVGNKDDILVFITQYIEDKQTK